MNLQRASGRIENLRVVEDKRNVLFGPQMQEAAGLSSIIFAAAGMGGAAVQTSMNSDAAADDVALYSFEISGVKYAGCTRKAAFKDGDEVEIVFEARHAGNEVLGVRRPSTRSMWLYPYMSRGSWAAVRHGLFVWILASLVATIVFVPIIGLVEVLSEGGFNLSLFTFGTSITVAGSFALLALIGLLLAPKFLRFASAATEVFSAFGYPDPKNVDLHKSSKAYRKAHKLPYDNFTLWY